MAPPPLRSRKEHALQSFQLTFQLFDRDHVAYKPHSEKELQGGAESVDSLHESARIRLSVRFPSRLAKTERATYDPNPLEASTISYKRSLWFEMDTLQTRLPTPALRCTRAFVLYAYRQGIGLGLKNRLSSNYNVKTRH